jgi:hypothetical protein
MCRRRPTTTAAYDPVTTPLAGRLRLSRRYTKTSDDRTQRTAHYMLEAAMFALCGDPAACDEVERIARMGRRKPRNPQQVEPLVIVEVAREVEAAASFRKKGDPGMAQGAGGFLLSKLELKFGAEGHRRSNRRLSLGQGVLP